MISYTKDGERLVAVASKQSLSRKPFSYQWAKMEEEEIRTWIKETLKRGHLSPWEHSVYTFVIEGCSRVLTHQLVRHRIASYTQLSQRYSKIVGEYFKYTTPPSIKERSEAQELFERFMKMANEVYERLLEMGIRAEDARYVLPQAIHTKIVVTMNARELLHFFSLRACTKAQWEIRRVAWLLWRELMNIHPELFKYAGPRCLLHENLVRENPLTLEEFLNDKTRLVSERCPEMVPREGIRSCVYFAIRDSGLTIRQE